MTEQIDPIPDDLPTCQERLRAVLERLHDLERQLHDLERQLDETCATTEELQRSYACLKEEYLGLKRLFFGPRRERLPEAPGNSTSLMRMRRRLFLLNRPISRRLRTCPGASIARGTAAGRFPTICPGRTSPMTSPQPIESAAAAVRRCGSART